MENVQIDVVYGSHVPKSPRNFKRLNGVGFAGFRVDFGVGNDDALRGIHFIDASCKHSRKY
jgi:hypothetical protein